MAVLDCSYLQKNFFELLKRFCEISICEKKQIRIPTAYATTIFKTVVNWFSGEPTSHNLFLKWDCSQLIFRRTNKPLPIPEMRGQNVLLPLPQGRYQVLINKKKSIKEDLMLFSIREDIRSFSIKVPQGRFEDVFQKSHSGEIWGCFPKNSLKEDLRLFSKKLPQGRILREFFRWFPGKYFPPKTFENESSRRFCKISFWWKSVHSNILSTGHLKTVQHDIWKSEKSFDISKTPCVTRIEKVN